MNIISRPEIIGFVLPCKVVLLKKFLIIIGVDKLSSIAIMGGGLKTTPLALIENWIVYFNMFSIIFLKTF